MKPGLLRIEGSLASSLARAQSPGLLRADPVLVAQGWKRRFTADAQRAREAMELYEKLGFEVRAEPVRHQDLHDNCDDCGFVAAFHFLAIYTREKTD